jgi:hypothetical protein
MAQGVIRERRARFFFPVRDKIFHAITQSDIEQLGGKVARHEIAGPRPVGVVNGRYGIGIGHSLFRLHMAGPLQFERPGGGKSAEDAGRINHGQGEENSFPRSGQGKSQTVDNCDSKGDKEDIRIFCLWISLLERGFHLNQGMPIFGETKRFFPGINADVHRYKMALKLWRKSVVV